MQRFAEYAVDAGPAGSVDQEPEQEHAEDDGHDVGQPFFAAVESGKEVFAIGRDQRDDHRATQERRDRACKESND